MPRIRDICPKTQCNRFGTAPTLQVIRGERRSHYRISRKVPEKAQNGFRARELGRCSAVRPFWRKRISMDYGLRTLPARGMVSHPAERRCLRSTEFRQPVAEVKSGLRAGEWRK